MKLAFLAGTAAATLLSSVVNAASPDDWRSQSIYFLLTDRFARADNSTTATCNTDDRIYCGGSWQGIINKLDYIQGMGFTAIWITPVTEQLPQNTSDGSSYHGYWQQNIYELNDKLGTADDLKALSQALHDRGMYLMVDVVANHMGYAGNPNDVDYSVFNPFNSQDYFHSYCPITDYDDHTMVEQCWMGDETVCLPDLDTESSKVKDIWYSWIGDLVSNYSIDGLRVDTVAEVDKDFWTGYQQAAGVFAVGEVDNGDSSYVCPFQGPLDGVLNYPTYFPLVRAFQSSDGSMSDLADMINTVKSACSDSNLLGSFSENHDNPRFASYTDDIALAKNVLTYTILADGIPIIYAGQEQHYGGGNDPANREATWLSGYNTDSELYKWVAQMNKIRNFAISTDKGYTTYKNWPIYHDNNNLAMRKGSNGTQIITVVSNVGAGGGEYTLTVTDAGFDAGTQLTELVTCTEVTVGDNGDVSVPMNSGLPSILYPASNLNGARSPCSE